MLRAVLAQVRQRYPDATITIAPSHKQGHTPFDKVVEAGCMPKAQLWQFGIQWGDFAAFLPRKLREMYGLVLDRDIDVVIDAAGFAYSDQWGPNSSKDLLRSARRWRKNGTKTVLLPQAMGPYTNAQTVKLVRDWIKYVDLVFPRESDSYRYLTELTGEQSKIVMSPDFTNLLSGTLPEDFDGEQLKVALVPNYRMIDKTKADESDAYIPFMARCARYLKERDRKPFILVHESENDAKVANAISSEAGGVPIINETDPLHIKGILGACDATIGSRYHGLVSALSQGVPSLATGWSHKYQRLFEDYDFIEGIVSVLDSETTIQQKLDLITQQTTAEPIQQNLLARSERLKQQSRDMWDLVWNLIES
jgi:colanic acid/amylovoran biosynthesis protein